jgi:uncharacterized protein YbjQ (UPF0145 family)
MPSCKSCGIEVSVLRGGRCKECSSLYRAAKDGDSSAASALAKRGGEVPEKFQDALKLGDAVKSMIVSTEAFVPDITDRIGIVTGQCALGMNIFSDLTAEVRDVIGGRSAAYQDALKKAKDQCILEMKIEAADLGANAVVGVDLDFNEITGGGGLFGGKGMIMAVATGTAVKMRDIE